MPLFTIFRTEKESEETKIVGQTTKSSVPQQSQIVQQVTGQKANTAGKTENTSVFNTPDYKVDFIDKDSLGGKLPD